MNAWVLRGVGLAAVHVVVRALLGFAIAQWPVQGSPLRWVSVVIVVLAAGAWGYVDGTNDRRQNSDPDHGEDLTMLWLKAALLGGVTAGAAAWIVDWIPKFDLGDNSLIFELTSGAAWTVLLIFVPALVGGALGRFLVTRKANKATAPQQAPVGVGAGAGDNSQYNDRSSNDGYKNDGYEDTLRYEDTVRYSDTESTGSHARPDDDDARPSLHKRTEQ